MSTALAIILGAMLGAVGFLPLHFALVMRRHAVGATVGIQALTCLVGIGASFLLMAAVSLVFVKVARPFTLPFMLSEAIALCIVAICYGMAKMRG